MAFRERLLARAHDVQQILRNMVLFKCKICKPRFPTFHPARKPVESLDCTAVCSVEVHEIDDHVPENARLAPFCSGTCARCHKNLQRVSGDRLLTGVATFSDRNNMDPLAGMDDAAVLDPAQLPAALPMDPLLQPDDCRLRREYMHLFRSATVVESMLVSLNHMQVDVVYLRGPRHRGSGLTGFRKNIISFPQEFTDLKALVHFLLTRLLGVRNLVKRSTTQISCPRRRR